MLARRSCLVRYLAVLSTLSVAVACATPALGVLVVNDQWRDTNRTEPTTTTTAGPYSENGVDGDGDGDIESRWWRSGTGGTMNVTAPGGGAATNGSPNVLRNNVPSGTSATWTTYMTPESTSVNLANVGDSMTVTWIFALTGVNATSTTGTGFRLAIVDSTSTSRLISDATPASDTYTGYAMFMNMATTIGSTDPFRLHERSAPGTASALLSAGGSWAALDDEETSGTAGYADGVSYTFAMTFTHNVSNGLDIAASMTGGSVGGDGSLNVSFVDATPNGGSFKFDTFAARPGQAEDTAGFFETSLFRVEFTPAAIPEVSSFALVGLVGMIVAGFNGTRRRRVR